MLPPHGGETPYDSGRLRHGTAGRPAILWCCQRPPRGLDRAGRPGAPQACHLRRKESCHRDSVGRRSRLAGLTLVVNGFVS